MKKFIITLLTIACAATVSAQNFRDNIVVSHRGAWKNTGHPQNSLASFRAAAEMGCHGSECDVHLTADDSLVITYQVMRREGYCFRLHYDELQIRLFADLYGLRLRCLC